MAGVVQQDVAEVRGSLKASRASSGPFLQLRAGGNDIINMDEVCVLESPQGKDPLHPGTPTLDSYMGETETLKLVSLSLYIWVSMLANSR